MLPASTDLPPPSHSRSGILVLRALVAIRPLCFEPSMQQNRKSTLMSIPGRNITTCPKEEEEAAQKNDEY